jgi:hypothetical protein
METVVFDCRNIDSPGVGGAGIFYLPAQAQAFSIYYLGLECARNEDGQSVNENEYRITNNK